MPALKRGRLFYCHKTNERKGDHNAEIKKGEYWEVAL